MNTAPFLYSRLLLLVCAICSSVRLCARDPEFVDVTERSGIEFLHRCGSPEKNGLMRLTAAVSRFSTVTRMGTWMCILSTRVRGRTLERPQAR